MSFTMYGCKECGSDLNLNSNNLFPPDFYFEAGNKITLSFAAVDAEKFRFEKEDKIRPFFETMNYWGIQRKRTKIKYNSCNHLIGYIYDDGPPLTGGIGQYGFGPSQVVPRAPRYRFNINSGLNMKKQIMDESEKLCIKKSPPPPPLPPPPGYGSRKIDGDSITNKQIKKYWRQKQIVEEEHLFAAIKAAARVRARNLSAEDYKRFEESLDMEDTETEVREGIKDWWTKSRYAYLNQPALGSADSLKRKRFTSYIPNCFSFKPCNPLYATSLNVC